MIAKILLALFSAVLGLIGLDQDFPLHDERSTKKTLHFAGDGARTLDVRTLNGSMRVSGYDGADVQLDVRQTIAAATDADLQKARQQLVVDTTDQAATIDVVIREPRGTVCGEQWNGRPPAWWDRVAYESAVELVIQVPRDTRLRLCTVNGGEVHVEGTSADFDIEDVNGRISLEQVAGSGRLSSVNGRITASFTQPPRRDSFFKTVNGSIVTTFPAGLSADLRMKTFNGGLFTDFDVEAVTAASQPAERRAGRLMYRSNQFTTVRVGRGGPELTFDAFNGDVRVLRGAN